MTLFVVDVSRHQVERPDPLDLARAKAAGFTIANIQLDRGRQADVLPAWAGEYATEARRLGMGVSTYRWLDARINGRYSAARAYERIAALGGPDGVAHVVDCEDNATLPHLVDYVTAMTELLGRPPAIYSGRWWLAPRGWHVADLSPWLWSAPSAGYLTGYPGDDSRHWQVTVYGGYTQLAVMQYTVAPIPGTGDCSLSAIRDPHVWDALTGGRGVRATNMQVLTGQIKADHPGVVVYGIGDAAHQQSPSDHNEDDTPGSNPAQTDADSNPEHRAIDPMIGPSFSAAQAEVLVRKLVGRPANRARLYNVIYNRRIWRRNGGWAQEVYTGSNPHTDHPHISGWAGDDENSTPWDLADDVPAATSQRGKSMFLIHKTGPTRFALVGETTWLDWLATDTITTPVGTIGGQELANGYAAALGNSALVTPAQWEAIKDRVADPTEVTVEVDAEDVAAALAANPALLAAIAKAVNDEAHARSAE